VIFVGLFFVVVVVGLKNYVSFLSSSQKPLTIEIGRHIHHIDKSNCTDENDDDYYFQKTVNQKKRTLLFADFITRKMHTKLTSRV
jgi:hypothetical protein